MNTLAYDYKKIITDVDRFVAKALGINNNIKRFSSYIYALQNKLMPGNTEGGSITVPLTSCLTGLG